MGIRVEVPCRRFLCVSIRHVTAENVGGLGFVGVEVSRAVGGRKVGKEGGDHMSKLPTDLHITYQLQYRKCGKPTCGTCKRGPGHGPYWYAYWREGNKLRSGYIGKTQPTGIAQSVVARAEARLMLARVGA
jgi:hypothetical protein